MTVLYIPFSRKMFLRREIVILQIQLIVKPFSIWIKCTKLDVTNNRISYMVLIFMNFISV